MNHNQEMTFKDYVFVIGVSIIIIIICVPVLHLALKHQPKVTEDIKVIDKKADMPDGQVVPYIVGKTKDGKTVRLNSDMRGTDSKYDFHDLKEGQTYKITHTKYSINISRRQIISNITDS